SQRLQEIVPASDSLLLQTRLLRTDVWREQKDRLLDQLVERDLGNLPFQALGSAQEIENPPGVFRPAFDFLLPHAVIAIGACGAQSRDEILLRAECDEGAEPKEHLRKRVLKPHQRRFIVLLCHPDLTAVVLE